MKKFVYEFLPRFFTSVNISKIIVIFSVGFSLRFLIAYFGGVQVFVEYIHPVSIAFYSFMSIFVVFIGDLFSFFNISIIPDFIIQFFSYLVWPFSLLIQLFSSIYTSLISFYSFVKISFINYQFNSLKLYVLPEDTKGKGKGKAVDYNNNNEEDYNNFDYNQNYYDDYEYDPRDFDYNLPDYLNRPQGYNGESSKTQDNNRANSKLKHVKK
jgi:hypothetical protein